METPEQTKPEMPTFLLHREEVAAPLGSSLFYLLACVYVTLLIGSQVAHMIGRIRKGGAE